MAIFERRHHFPRPIIVGVRFRVGETPRHSGDYSGTWTWEIAEGHVTPVDEPGVVQVGKCLERQYLEVGWAPRYRK